MTLVGSALDGAIDRLEGGHFAGRILRDAPLGALTTYRVGGPASALVELATADDLDALLAAIGDRGVEVLVIGRGSNLLVHDQGFDGLAITLSGWFERVEVDGDEVRAGAAAKLPVVARTSVGAGLTGFEWAVGVPGSIGGAVRMNAGGHGAEIVDSLVEAEIADLAEGVRTHRGVDSLDLGYRSSALAAADMVVTARLALAPGDADAGRAEIRSIVQWRRDNQPGGQNAGSVFTNPPGDSAGRLIDAAGCKGLRIGTAAVSTKHANFIQADPGGRATDVRAVMAAVVERVDAVHGVVLHPETHLVGFPPGTEHR